jgi:hypothetical protein
MDTWGRPRCGAGGRNGGASPARGSRSPSEATPPRAPNAGDGRRRRHRTPSPAASELCHGVPPSAPVWLRRLHTALHTPRPEDENGHETCISWPNSGTCGGTPGGNRTHDLRFRKPALYPTELRARERATLRAGRRRPQVHRGALNACGA